MDLDLEYDDLQPGISNDENTTGIRRILQIGAGVLLVIAGIAMMVIPGPGVLTALVGLNLIKPDNFIVKWIRRRVPGIPEDGAVPKRYLVTGALFFVGTTAISILYGDELFDWFTGLF